MNDYSIKKILIPRNHCVLVHVPADEAGHADAPDLGELVLTKLQRLIACLVPVPVALPATKFFPV